jgi:hypothetical protein
MSILAADLSPRLLAAPALACWVVRAWSKHLAGTWPGRVPTFCSAKAASSVAERLVGAGLPISHGAAASHHERKHHCGEDGRVIFFIVLPGVKRFRPVRNPKYSSLIVLGRPNPAGLR